MKHLVSIEIFILFSTSTFLCSRSTEIPICEHISRKCCSNYKWNNETQTCEKCLSGFSGKNCSLPCPYPFYGDNCQGKCECDNDTCDISTGCRVVTADTRIISLVTNATVDGLTENITVSLTENSTDVPVRRQKPSSVNDFLLVLIETLCCVNLLLICAHIFVYMYERRNRTDMNNIDTTVNYHRTSTIYENINIDIQSTSDL